MEESSLTPPAVPGDERPSLTPLRCASCGRPVPIGDGDTARCPGCGNEVGIPAEYLALRAAGRQGDEARARAQVISEELARPTSLPMRFWMGAGTLASAVVGLALLVWIGVALVICAGVLISEGPVEAVLVMCIGVVIGLPLLYDQGLHGIAETVGVDLADVWGGAGSYALLGLAYWGVILVPLIFAGYASSFEAVRTALRVALAAKPAELAGGPEQCRSCGAPLAMPADRLHVRCMYCGADNLVHVPAGRVEQIAEGVQVVCTDLESAIAEERAVARSGRQTAAWALLWGLSAAPICVVMGLCVAALNEDLLTFWRGATMDSPMLPRFAENPELPRGVATEFTVRKTFEGCDDDDCWVYYYVALGAGETVHLQVEGGDLRVDQIAGRYLGPWYNPTYEWRATEVFDGAPYRGWYRVRLITSKSDDGVPVVTWTSGPPRPE